VKRRFRLGIITDEVSQRMDEAVSFAGRYGLDAIELRSVNGKGIHQLSDEEIDAIGRLALEHGLAVSGIAGPLFKCELNAPEQIEEHLAMAERLADIAVKLGAPLLRGFTFWASPELPFADAVPAIAEHLRKLIPLLERSGIVLALEYDPSTYASNAAKTAAVLEAVDSPWIQALYDPGNNIWDPDGEVPYPAGYEAIRERLCHVHLKDAVRTPDGIEAVAVGTGEVDYRGLLRRLDREGYNGFLIIETHYRMKSQLTEEQLKRPAGNAFSEGGLEASAHCTEHLLHLLRELGMEEAELSARIGDSSEQ